VQSYESEEFVVTLDIKGTRWINCRTAPAESVMVQVYACPSGALQQIRKTP
jgi:uncharacterized Fe-S cluster protein YjdI